MPDANMAHAASNIVSAAYGSAGQRCMVISVVVAVGEKTADKLIEEIKPQIENIKIGPGTQPDIDMGPVISLQQRDFLLDCLEKGQAEGAKLIIDGRHHACPAEGFFIGPSLFDHVDARMSIYQNELFGPILVVIRVNQLEDALELIHQHRYGNGGIIFTQSGAWAEKFTHEVQCGMVGINIPIPVPIVSHPFGGWKESSFGDRPMHALESIHFYTHHKSVTTTWPESEPSLSSFNMPHL
jgi:malonate-semialdehyde dehydrogenase (acetylating)/methylmalonate-semialdehyde dehydrogenase